MIWMRVRTHMSLVISEKEWQIIKRIRKIIWQLNCNQLKHNSRPHSQRECGKQLSMANDLHQMTQFGAH